MNNVVFFAIDINFFCFTFRLPSNNDFDHQRFLRYLMQTLDAYVDIDYSLVYFHYGLTSKNKPPLRWLWDAYKALDRRYKKNLKTLFLVHPTNFIRVVWNFFKPIIRYNNSLIDKCLTYFIFSCEFSSSCFFERERKPVSYCVVVLFLSIENTCNSNVDNL